MDDAIAKTLLDRELAHLRGLGWCALAARLGSETKEITGPDGSAYQVESIVAWDAAPGGRLRLIVAIDDGGRRAFKPLTVDELVDPG